jgi:Transglycosylase SLT domain
MKKITKTLIYLAIAMVIYPSSVVNAESSVSDLNVVTSEVIVKPNTEVKVAIVNVKNVIDETINSRKVAVVSNVSNGIPVNNSRDWSNSKYTKEEIQAKICQVFTSNCQEALIIAKNESGFRPWAVSKTNDYGVFQINCRWQKRRVGGDCNKFLDVDTNIRIAKQIYNEQGWNPWVTKKFL